MYRITLIPGDGIGQELLPYAREVLEALALPISFIEAEAGWGTFEQYGTALPKATFEAVQLSDATLFGAVSSPSERVQGYRSPIVALRKAFELYACVRPVAAQSLQRPIRLAVVRENTEGLYSGREERVDNLTATSTRVITRPATERIVRWAIEYARSHKYERLTIVHKANVLRESCGLFRETALNLLHDVHDLEINELLVDNAAYQLVRAPEQFGVIVTSNMFGDILSDIASHWGGGLGVAASANYGPYNALFEPVHGSAPDLVGTQRANPFAMLNAVVLMLDYLGEHTLRDRLQTAITLTERAGCVTPDLGGSATTAQVVADIIERCIQFPVAI